MVITKRQFFKGFIACTFMTSFIGRAFAGNNKLNLTTTKNKEVKMPFTLPPLPYEQDALEPHISAKTFSFHYGKHHNAYVTNLNKLIEGTDFANATLEQIIAKSDGGIFNNAAQVWNHTFFWSSMKPGGGNKPSGKLAEKIDEDFGSFDKFKEEFANAAATQFGSGWAWLVLDNGKLKVVKTPNAETPIRNGQTPLITLDVWEHAYYLDYQNRRPDFIQVFLNNLANWSFAEENFANAKVSKAA